MRPKRKNYHIKHKRILLKAVGRGEKEKIKTLESMNLDFTRSHEEGNASMISVMKRRSNIPIEEQASE